MPKHTAIYCRVSSKAQDTASQEADLNAFAGTVQGTVRWYRDKQTGKTMDRPGWAALDKAIQAGQVAELVVWRLDRLGRTASGLTALFDQLQARKVNLRSLRDGLDLSTPAGRLMANVLASVAQYETEVRGERVAAGQAVARAKGKTWGGSKPGLPKQVNPDKARAIISQREAGTSVAAIARAVNVSRPTVYAVLANAEQYVDSKINSVKR